MNLQSGKTRLVNACYYKRLERVGDDRPRSARRIFTTRRGPPDGRWRTRFLLCMSPGASLARNPFPVRVSLRRLLRTCLRVGGRRLLPGQVREALPAVTERREALNSLVEGLQTELCHLP